MKPHPRIRKTIKWGGAAVTVFLVVVWIGSAWWGIHWASTDGLLLGVGAGGIAVNFWPNPPPRSFPFGWHAAFHAPMWSWMPSRSSFLGGWQYEMPLWIPCGVVLLATLAAWRLDALARRRARVGFCPKCRYDRTGLAAGAVCPECGSASPS